MHLPKWTLREMTPAEEAHYDEHVRPFHEGPNGSYPYAVFLLRVHTGRWRKVVILSILPEPVCQIKWRFLNERRLVCRTSGYDWFFARVSGGPLYSVRHRPRPHEGHSVFYANDERMPMPCRCVPFDKIQKVA